MQRVNLAKRAGYRQSVDRTAPPSATDETPDGSGRAMVALLKMPMKIGPETADAVNWAERRMFPRKEVHSNVRGVRLDNTVPARRMPWLSLHLRDLSIGGLSAISPVQVERGERLTVSFPENG